MSLLPRSSHSARNARMCVQQLIIITIILIIIIFNTFPFIDYSLQSPSQLLDMCLQTPIRYSETSAQIGAYYQTSTQHLCATRVALDLFRRVYATAQLTIYIDSSSPSASAIIDSGAYSPISVLSYDSNGTTAKGSRGTYFDTAASCVSYIKRIVKAAENIDWLILLEDDVWLCNRINTSALHYDMNGQCIAQYSKAWDNLLHIPGENCYGGYGGFVLKASFLRSMTKMHMEEAINAILKEIKRPVASDELLSALLLRANGTIGRIADYKEKMTQEPVIVHQMKAFYHYAYDNDDGLSCTTDKM